MNCYNNVIRYWLSVLGTELEPPRWHATPLTFRLTRSSKLGSILGTLGTELGTELGSDLEPPLGCPIGSELRKELGRLGTLFGSPTGLELRMELGKEPGDPMHHCDQS
jgi:hypothetical protein